jgi:predicted phosphodiesterase
MRLALFSDIHGNLSGTRAVLDAIDRLGGADAWYAAGDTLPGGPGTEDLLELLLSRRVHLLRGNGEETVLDPEGSSRFLAPRWQDYGRTIAAWTRARLSPASLALLAALPLTATVEYAPGHRVVICHAAPDDPWARVCSPRAPLADLRRAYGALDAEVIVYGHWHGNHVLQLDGKLLVNVASVGLRSDGHSDFTLLEWAEGHWVVQQHRVPYDAAAEATLMAKRQVPVP